MQQLYFSILFDTARAFIVPTKIRIIVISIVAFWMSLILKNSKLQDLPALLFSTCC